MKADTISGRFRNELYGVLIFACFSTLVMIYFGAFERLYIFTRLMGRQGIGDLAVFFPSFLAIGFTYFSYRRIKQLEFEIFKRSRLEKALRESENRYMNLSITDDLTKLYNSRYFYHMIGIEMERSARYDHPLSVILLDIDDFKQYNDSYGHLEGDKVLKTIGKIMRQSLRKSDSAYRYGGEEFAVILPETRGKDALIVSERIRKRFEAETFEPKPNEIARGTISLGVSQYKDGETVKDFIRRVDNALYDAKARGKNQVFSHMPGNGRGKVPSLLMPQE
jgi:diguanylate cyclase (GGDEF)-like protein